MRRLGSRRRSASAARSATPVAAPSRKTESAARRELRHEPIDQQAARDAAEAVAQQSRANDHPGAIGDDHVRIARDKRYFRVASSEHHELWVRGDDEGALAAIEPLEDARGGAIQIEAIESHTQHVNPVRHAGNASGPG